MARETTWRVHDTQGKSPAREATLPETDLRQFVTRQMRSGYNRGRK